MAHEAAFLGSVKNGCHDIETISNLGITEEPKEIAAAWQACVPSKM